MAGLNCGLYLRLFGRVIVWICASSTVPIGRSHCPGAHDDLANAVAGALTLAAGGPPRMIISDALLAWSRIPSRPLFAQSYRVF